MPDQDSAAVALPPADTAPSADAQDAPANTIPARSPRLVKARVLVACPHGQPNAVVALPAAAVKAGKAAGELDDDPAAVAYAETLPAA